MNTTENNRLIAEFMLKGNSEIYVPFYNEKWDWLMPVVDKIQSLYETDESFGVLIDICTTHVRISVVDKGFETTIDFKLENSISKIQAVYKAVTNFINWYNKNNCKYIKREGESCTLNNNCTYPNCETPNENQILGQSTII